MTDTWTATVSGTKALPVFTTAPALSMRRQMEVSVVSWRVNTLAGLVYVTPAYLVVHDRRMVCLSSGRSTSAASLLLTCDSVSVPSMLSVHCKPVATVVPLSSKVQGQVSEGWAVVTVCVTPSLSVAVTLVSVFAAPSLYALILVVMGMPS